MLVASLRKQPPPASLLRFNVSTESPLYRVEKDFSIGRAEIGLAISHRAVDCPRLF
jgi:hypothetical protein